MCGRYHFRGEEVTLMQLLESFGLSHMPMAFMPRYNIAPRQKVPVIVNEGELNKPKVKMMRWGLIPSWATDEKVGDKMINAKSETISERPSFRKAYERRRCLVLADGFFEWQVQGGMKIPFRFSMKDDSIFCMAGIWEKWIRPPKDGEFVLDDLNEPEPNRVIESFAILTTTANKMVQRVHDRMPVIVGKEHWDWWLDAQNHDGAFVHFMLRSFPAEDMDCRRVSRLVNSAKNESPLCLNSA